MGSKSVLGRGTLEPLTALAPALSALGYVHSSFPKTVPMQPTPQRAAGSTRGEMGPQCPDSLSTKKPPCRTVISDHIL